MVEVAWQSETGKGITDMLPKRGLAPLHSPTFLDIEVLGALRKLHLRGRIDEEDLNDAVRRLSRLPRIRHEFHRFFERILSFRHNLTPYDAAYVVLAQEIDALLLTLDRGQAEVAGRHGVEVLEPPFAPGQSA